MSTDQQIQQLASLQAIMAGTANLDLSELVHSYAQQVAAKSTQDIADALAELTSLGIDPDKYIAPSKQHIRNQREQVRIKAEAARHAQELQFAKEIHDEDMKRRRLATANAANSVGIPVS